MTSVKIKIWEEQVSRILDLNDIKDVEYLFLNTQKKYMITHVSHVTFEDGAKEIMLEEIWE